MTGSLKSSILSDIPLKAEVVNMLFWLGQYFQEGILALCRARGGVWSRRETEKFLHSLHLNLLSFPSVLKILSISKIDFRK